MSEPRDLILRAGDINLSDEIRVKSISDGTVFPAVAIPMESKQDFECPQAHLDLLEQLIREVRGVLTIGWRAQEQSFLSLLKQGLRNTVQVKAVNASEEQSEVTWKSLPVFRSESRIR
jgi:hypothetical protein